MTEQTGFWPPWWWWAVLVVAFASFILGYLAAIEPEDETEPLVRYEVASVRHFDTDRMPNALSHLGNLAFCPPSRLLSPVRHSRTLAT